MNSSTTYHVSSKLLANPDLQQALESRNFGTAFRLIQKFDGVSQGAIAAQIAGMTQGRISRIIHDKDRISSIDLVEKISDGLGIPGRFLGLAERTWEKELSSSAARPHLELQPAIDDGESEGAQILGILNLSGHANAIARRVSAARYSAVPVDKLEAVEVALANLVRDFHMYPPQIIAHRASSLQQVLEPLISRQCPPAVRIRIFTALAWSAAVLANAAFDVGSYRTTWAFCKEGYEFASMAGKRELVAWIRLTQSTTAYYEGSYKDAIAFAVDGRKVAGRTPIAARIASSSEARAHAAIGDTRGLNTAIRAAEEAFGTHEEDVYGSPGRYVFTLHPADMRCHIADALTVSGDTKRSNSYILESKASIDEYGIRGLMAMARIDEATNLIRGASIECEAAISLVNDAIDIVGSQPADWIGRRIERFVKEVSPILKTGSQLAELCDRLAQTPTKSAYSYTTPSKGDLL